MYVEMSFSVIGWSCPPTVLFLSAALNHGNWHTMFPHFCLCRSIYSRSTSWRHVTRVYHYTFCQIHLNTWLESLLCVRWSRKTVQNNCLISTCWTRGHARPILRAWYLEIYLVSSFQVSSVDGIRWGMDNILWELNIFFRGSFWNTIVDDVTRCFCLSLTLKDIIQFYFFMLLCHNA